ncbi:hypothetical protein IHE45_11G038000 [Dioscorea alata]|uniref:Uncharacterized protein n=1 Tax=Dioscorea alata TaxID=55571 RepID=A0ACB7V603_DIOAL|nr:hypothetical protein IHE45_11G038000 [Dioscorea alata]
MPLKGVASLVFNLQMCALDLALLAKSLPRSPSKSFFFLRTKVVMRGPKKKTQDALKDLSKSHKKMSSCLFMGELTVHIRPVR